MSFQIKGAHFIAEYNDDGFLIHSKSDVGGEFWNEYDYKRKMVHFISSTGYDTWHYDWPTFKIKNPQMT